MPLKRGTKEGQDILGRIHYSPASVVLLHSSQLMKQGEKGIFSTHINDSLSSNLATSESKVSLVQEMTIS